MKRHKGKIIGLICLGLITYFGKEKQQEKMAIQKNNDIYSQLIKPSTSLPIKARLAAPSTNNIPKVSVVSRTPQSFSLDQFKKDPSIRMTRGYEFLKNVAAVKKEHYTSQLGEIIQESNGYIFFQAPSHHDLTPVAISTLNNNLYPISSVLHIKGVTLQLRRQLLLEGHKEHYFHEPLKLLSIKTPPEKVMKTYSELLKKGFKVNLEVLKPTHQKI